MLTINLYPTTAVSVYQCELAFKFVYFLKWTLKCLFLSVEIILVSSLLLFLSPSALPLYGFPSFSVDG